MPALRQALHDFVIALTRILARLLPDRIPATFVGTDSSRELCLAIAQAGARRVLVVTDRMLAEIGIVERIRKHLEAAGVAVSVFDGVAPDPTFDHVRAGFAMLGRDGCDAVLALGGGSPMDAAKVIAAMATNGGSAERLEGRFRLRKQPLPLYAIPTTAGTGSEVTVAAVVSDPATHAKKFFVDPKLLPRMVALDPALMLGLPPAVTAATGMDALTHAVESYLARTATPQTREYATTAVRLIFENLPRAYAHGSDAEARKAMALAAWYAGLAFTRTNVGYVHAVAHTFGARYGTPHGRANAIVLPHVLEFSREAAQDRLAELARAIGLATGSETDQARAFVAAVRDLEEKIGIPQTLDALVAGDIPSIARQALAESFCNYPVPRSMDQAQCEALLRRMCA